MYCKKCGKELNDDAVVCVHCGCEVKSGHYGVVRDTTESKTVVGFLLGFFLGLLGLFGLLLYPAETNARRTFLKGWLIAFIAQVVITIIVVIIVSAAAASAVSTFKYYY